MSSSSKILSLSKKCQYFFERFECDVQAIFDFVISSKNLSWVKVNLLIRRGSIYLKADYFVPLRSYEAAQLNCDELINKLKEIGYMSSVEVDSNFNLTFCLYRPFVYKAVLEEVVKRGEIYGMSERSNSVLILVNNEDNKSFMGMRNNLLAEHVISILCNNKVKVYYSGSVFDSKPKPSNATQIICSEECCLKNTCREISELLSHCEWKKEDTEHILCIDAKVYLENKLLLDKYGKDINSIIISDEDKYDILNRVATVEHLLREHISKTPDVIIHIASHGINRVIWKVGILLEILRDSISIQSYIFNQAVKICDKSDISFVDYELSYKNEIERAMAHKYSVNISNDKVWSSRINDLVESVIKFDFLKLNPNMSLKLDLSNYQNTEKNTGIFVQYNFARLTNLFNKFEMKVNENYYEPLSKLEDVDFGLLRLEEEWNLFQYVVSFPKLVERILDSLLSESTLKTRYPLNGICVMLGELCHYLSLYYSKIRILAGPQKHLQKLMNARLWLLKGIYQILLNSFILLGIRGLEQM